MRPARLASRASLLTAAALLAAAGVPLAGCVAIVAPIAASGILAGQQLGIGRDDGKVADEGVRALPPPPFAAELPGAGSAVAPRAIAAELTAEPALAAESAVALPPADEAPSAPEQADAFTPTSQRLQAERFAALSQYVQNELRRQPSQRRSALLVNPAMLATERRMCGALPAAVLVDLDPAGGLVPLGGAVASQPDLGVTLAELRGQGITIAWLTDRPPTDARAIRARLAASSLDPAGADLLLVMRFANERKQERRAGLGTSHCIVAIAGDEMADFDELYLYLRDPAAALPLNAMLGDGWFLLPETPHIQPAD